MNITGTTQLFATFGNPNKGNPAVAAYNKVFERHDVDAAFVALECQDAKAITDAVRSLGMGGGTVTAPFKVDVMEHLDEIDEDARAIGAVNVVTNRNGHLVGRNSDWIGAGNALRSVIDVQDKKVALLGAGGAARAVAYGLAKDGAHVTVYNRTADTGRSFADTFGATFGGALEDVQPGSFDVLLNATRVGFKDAPEKCPVSAEVVQSAPVVFDAIANPGQTVLLQQATEAGCTVVGGLTMVANHAVTALGWLTGVETTTEEVFAAFGS